MNSDFRDINNYFLKKEKEKKEKKENDDAAEEPSEKGDIQEKGGEIQTVSEEEFFARNFEKYLPCELKKEDSNGSPSAIEHKKRSKRKSGAPSATIDLHGKTINEAMMLLERFIGTSAKKGIPLVLVIVGKGIHSDSGKPVLKEAVLSWLDGKGKKLVSSHRIASAKFGGSGAIVVSLKKNI